MKTYYTTKQAAIFIIVILTILVMSSEKASAETYKIGIQAGVCEANDNINMCGEKVVWHVYAIAAFPLTTKGTLQWTFTAEHYSAWDGSEDLNTNPNDGSGQFNYAGTGIEFRF